MWVDKFLALKELFHSMVIFFYVSANRTAKVLGNVLGVITGPFDFFLFDLLILRHLFI